MTTAMTTIDIEAELAVLTLAQQRDYVESTLNAKYHFEQGADHFDKAIALLSHVKREKLYLGTYRSFSAYVAAEFQQARNTLYEWINNADINQELSPYGYKLLTVAETEVLKHYPVEQRQAILAVAYGSAPEGKINAPMLQAAADAVIKIAHGPLSNRLKADTLNEAAIAHDAQVSEKQIVSRRFGQYHNELITTVEQVLDELPNKLRGLKESARIKIVIYTESE